MKRDKIMKRMFFVIILPILFSCSSMAPYSKVMTGPVDNECICIMGGLVVENMGIDDLEEALDSDIEVVLVGKHIIDGEDVLRGYHVITDENGYFFLENIPKGGFVIKGARIYIANSFSINVISQWRTNEIAYYVPYLQEELIRHDVRFVPFPPRGRIYNFGITYFGLHRGSADYGPGGVANTVLYQNFTSLNNQKLNIVEIYNKPNPITYFRQKFPDSEWFKVYDEERTAIR